MSICQIFMEYFRPMNGIFHGTIIIIQGRTDFCQPYFQTLLYSLVIRHDGEFIRNMWNVISMPCGNICIFNNIRIGIHYVFYIFFSGNDIKSSQHQRRPLCQFSENDLRIYRLLFESRSHVIGYKVCQLCRCPFA
ncbi:hypothetical protein EVA_06721 [gut metagenome]|uniref:Uncharacterized protein n=1 Tax=gut metagenome TaxID=749906 RepID=J9GWX5_9ZZZZ